MSKVKGWLMFAEGDDHARAVLTPQDHTNQLLTKELATHIGESCSDWLDEQPAKVSSMVIEGALVNSLLAFYHNILELSLEEQLQRMETFVMPALRAVLTARAKEREELRAKIESETQAGEDHHQAKGSTH